MSEKRIPVTRSQKREVIAPRYAFMTDGEATCLRCAALHKSEAEYFFCIHSGGPVYGTEAEARQWVCGAFEEIS